jgi:hypothetical protein
MDLSAPERPMVGQVARDLVQWTALLLTRRDGLTFVRPPPGVIFPFSTKAVACNWTPYARIIAIKELAKP